MDGRGETACRRWWRERSMRRNPCSRRRPRAEACQHQPARPDGAQRPADRKRARPDAKLHEAAGAKRAEGRPRAPSGDSANRDAQAFAASRTLSSASKPSLCIPSRSRMRSPMATPTLASDACIAPPKNSEGQILNGKIRAGKVGGFNPTLHFGIVGLVENWFHSRCFVSERFQRCQPRQSPCNSPALAARPS
jgi:hypothetical protein